MTYKNIFNKLQFKIIVNSDFCVLLTGRNAEYAVFENSGIKCLDMYTFEEVSKEFISYRYDIEMADMGDDKDEYNFQHSISKENLINFLFGIAELSGKDVDNFLLLKQYFGDDIHYKKDEDLLSLSLFSADEKIKNILLFNAESYRLLFSNTDCCWMGDRGQNKLVIAYDPYYLCNYCYNNNENFATFIMCKETSRFYLELPFKYDFEQYILLCKTASEKREALRFVISFITCNGIDNIDLNFHKEWVELIFILEKDADILKYIQYNANVRKNLRKMYLNSENQDIEIVKNQRRELKDKKLLYITFNLNIAELDIVTDELIKFYNLPLNIYDE